MNIEPVLVGAYWKNRKITAREYIQLCYTFLQKLQAFSPVFASRCVMVGTKAVVLPLDYSSFERILLESLSDRDYVYENPSSSNKSLTLDSTISGGFLKSFSDPDPEATDETAVSIRISAGAYGGKYSRTNLVLIEIPATSDLVTEGLEKAKQLLKLVVEHWQPSFAVLTSSQLRQALDPTRKNSFTVGPLTYFADEKIKSLVQDIAAVEDGPAQGVLLTINAPNPWTSSVHTFQPYYDRLNSAAALN